MESSTVHAVRFRACNKKSFEVGSGDPCARPSDWHQRRARSDAPYQPRPHIGILIQALSRNHAVGKGSAPAPVLRSLGEVGSGAVRRVLAAHSCARNRPTVLVTSHAAGVRREAHRTTAEAAVVPRTATASFRLSPAFNDARRVVLWRFPGRPRGRSG